VKLISKNSNLCDYNPPTSQTDGRTDRQTTCDRNTALCTKVHRAVKTVGRITYIVLVQTLNHAQSINQSVAAILASVSGNEKTDQTTFALNLVNITDYHLPYSDQIFH